MSVEDALRSACDALRISPPKRPPVPGRWTRCDTLESNGKGDAEVMVMPDRSGVHAVNWQTGQRSTVWVGGEERPVTAGGAMAASAEAARQREEQDIVAAVCERIVQDCTQEPHPYLARKGFPDEPGLVHADPASHFPATRLGDAMRRALPEGDGPWLIVPGRIGRRITTVQFISPSGEKKNILRGRMGGACHRIATGPETWVCEGLATALSVRAALRMIGRHATVLSAFSAANVAKVAASLPGSIIAADHDAPQEALHGRGAGEFYAASSGCRWVMPPERGDYNDMHQSAGLRAVALHLREVAMG